MDSLSGTNGDGATNQQSSDIDIQRLVQTVNLIHDPSTSNDTRKDAIVLLDEAKARPNAAEQGVWLAMTKSQASTVRHFGLSMLEYHIKYAGHYSQQLPNETLQQYVEQLAHNIEDTDPVFLRNKIASLWAELAKRLWPDQWQPMDSSLVRLWQGTFAHQAIVSHVLETLSEEVFLQDELKLNSSKDLGKACVIIFTSVDLFRRLYPTREVMSVIRGGEEGWFQRLLQRLQWCLEKLSTHESQVHSCAMQTLKTLRSVISWISLTVVSETGCLEIMSYALQAEDNDVQLAALEVLHALYHRPLFSDTEVEALAFPLLSSQGIGLLKTLFQSKTKRLEELDEVDHFVQKKLSEIYCALCTFLQHRPQLMNASIDVKALLETLLQILQHPSLVVSIPTLYAWNLLLSCTEQNIQSALDSFVGPLLEICSQRLVRYESLENDTDDLTLQILMQDFDTPPERHAFIGNYRRFCTDAVSKIVHKSPFEAMQHILTQADATIEEACRMTSSIDKSTYRSNSLHALRVDAQCAVVLSASKGYCSWMKSYAPKGEHKSQRHLNLISLLDNWCNKQLQLHCEDPTIQRSILQLVDDLIIMTVPETSPVILKFVEKVFAMNVVVDSSGTPYNEALKELLNGLPRLLQRIAIRIPDTLQHSYAQIEARVASVTSIPNMEPRITSGYRALLFTIVHRCSSIDNEERDRTLSSMIEHVTHQWRNGHLSNSLASFDSFCQLLNLDKFPEYFLSHHADQIQEWSKQELDSSGKQMKDTIQRKVEDLPLHLTRSFLAASTDRVVPGTNNYAIAEKHWDAAIPVVLPNLLKLVSYAHAFGNSDQWSQHPPGMKTIIQRIMVDRVWQSGISSESKDDFFVKVQESKNKLEGLASAVRATIRNVRELCYWILHSMSQFPNALFKHDDLAQPLTESLYQNLHTLTPHQISTLLKLSTTLIENCPIEARDSFLPPLITSLFKQLDTRLSAEWEAMDWSIQTQEAEETLDREMKYESVLRQLTHSAASLVSTLLSRPLPPVGTQTPLAVPLRNLVLRHSTVISTLLMFSTRVLCMHDGRSCSLVTRALRSLLPVFLPLRPRGHSLGSHEDMAASNNLSSTVEQGPGAETPVDAQLMSEVQEYFSDEVLKAAITAFHDPYFTDLQRELATLIGGILHAYLPMTPTAHKVLLSLPGMSAQVVNPALEELQEASGDRQQRAIVLRLLEGLRGVSIHEMGKVTDGAHGVGNRTARYQQNRAGVQDKYMAENQDSGSGQIRRGGSEELGGVSELFE